MMQIYVNELYRMVPSYDAIVVHIRSLKLEKVYTNSKKIQR
ncbi:hypothetical protein L606_001500000010 [Bacillus subtilis J25]|nr:hypothetical protein L608_000600001400 [Bacillus subtilis J23]TWG71708.1 hypothetical protein L606_001500000010 [Bacillus subtilis J25]